MLFNGNACFSNGIGDILRADRAEQFAFIARFMGNDNLKLA